MTDKMPVVKKSLTPDHHGTHFYTCPCYEDNDPNAECKCVSISEEIQERALDMKADAQMEEQLEAKFNHDNS
jgi:hypothetical protein